MASEDPTIGQRLADEFATGDADLSDPPQIAAIPTPAEDTASLYKSVRAIKSVVDILTGTSGSALDKALTTRDLINEGTLSYSPSQGLIGGTTTFSITGGAGGGGPPPDDYVDPRPVLDTPPTPTNLVATGAFKTIVLTWDLFNYRNHAYTEVWRATTDNLGVAVLLDSTPATTYTDATGTLGAVYYYWVRAVSDQSVAGAFNSSNGTLAGLALIGNTDLGPLIIEADNLANGAVIGDKISAGAIAVGSAAIANGAIRRALIELAAIDTARIDDLAVTDAKIANLNATKINAGTISADRIAALSITAGKIDTRGLDIRDANGNIIFSSGIGVSRGGGYVNTDPLIEWPNEWTLNPVTGAAPVRYTNFAVGTNGLLTAWDKTDGGYTYVQSAKFPVSSFKTYLIESSLYMWSSNASVHYLGVAFYDAVGNLISGNATGWPGMGTYHYYGLVGQSSPAGATRYTHTFGALATAKIPSAATHARVMIYANYQDIGGVHRWSWGGAQVREINEFVPSALNPITTGNASTYIANAAIGSAQIGTITANQITTGSLTGQTITGGTFTGSVFQTAAPGNNQRVVINESASNELRAYGDRGDGNYEMLASVGVTSTGSGDFAIGQFGTPNSSRVALYARSSTGNAVYGSNNSPFGAIAGFNTGTSGPAVVGVSSTGHGVSGSTGGGSTFAGVQGSSSGAASGVRGFSSSGYGGYFSGNNTNGALFLTPTSSLPSNAATGSLHFIDNGVGQQYLAVAVAGVWYRANLDVI